MCLEPITRGEQSGQLRHVGEGLVGAEAEQHLSALMHGGRRAEPEDVGTGRPTRLDTGRRILDHRRFRRIDAQGRGSGEVDVRGRFASVEFHTGEDLALEYVVEADLLQLHRDLGAVRA